MKENSVKRFDIYLYDFGTTKGSIQCGVRPVLVLQDDKMNRNSPTTVVAAITSATDKQRLPSHVFIGQDFGLDKPSMVMMEQIRTVNATDLGVHIGHITDDKLARKLVNAIKKAFGMWHYEPRDETSIRCLCPQCLEAYKATGSYIIRRLDPFQNAKDTCDCCNRIGWDYVVTDRLHKVRLKR